MRREDVHEARDRLAAVGRVQGREHEVTRLGSREPDLDSLQVAHFAHEHHVGVLAQRSPQRRREAHAVGADLALIHDGPLVADQELDRVLDRDDVIGARRVDVVDDGRKRRRLARARRAGDQDEAPTVLGDEIGRASCRERV